MLDRITLIDYHKGNIKSVERGLASCGVDVLVSDRPQDVARAQAIVLPGVGAFTDAMGTLDELGITQVLKERIAEGAPFLGICLGQHLMYEAGEEHASGSQPTPGLGLIPGTVGKMPQHDASGEFFKVPHVGWNSIEPVAGSPLLHGIEPGEHFYFTHSYISPASDFTIAETKHSVTFPSAVQRGNAYGVQFHPEKSSAAGAKVLGNFVSICRDLNR